MRAWMPPRTYAHDPEVKNYGTPSCWSRRKRRITIAPAICGVLPSGALRMLGCGLQREDWARGGAALATVVLGAETGCPEAVCEGQSGGFTAG
ncbi:hypothetical protein MMC27_003923 [Xylographa pallens]|nr:hypothetical protein [Xylographa pallens]